MSLSSHRRRRASDRTAAEAEEAGGRLELELARAALADLRARRPELSIAECLAMLPQERRAAWLGGLSTEQRAALRYDWSFWARPSQVPAATLPDGEPWRFWFVRTGRGWGKNRAASEWLVDRVRRGIARHIALLARTAGDIRSVVVEQGPSSILSVSPPDFRPRYEPSKCRLTWPNGAVATTFSVDQADALRGPQFDTALCDEVASWPPGQPVSARSSGCEAFDNLNMALRLPTSDPSVPPQAAVISTPRPTALVRWLTKHPRTLLTTGSTYENRANLDEETLRELTSSYRGTSLEQQELYGALLDELEGALWRRDQIRREPVDPAGLASVVVAVDPSARADGHDAGILVVGRLRDRSPPAAAVLADCSTGGGPLAWGKAAIGAYRTFAANAIVAETNHGGDMVRMVIEQAAGPEPVPFEELKATRSKASRAEPVVLLYQQGRVVHDAGTPLTALEDQMCTSRPGTKDPFDRIDALVWGVWALLLRGARGYAHGSLPGLDPEVGVQENPYDF